jgi:hypothetical protein
MGATRRSDGVADLGRFDTKNNTTDSDTQSAKTLHTITEATTVEQQDGSPPLLTETMPAPISDGTDQNDDKDEAAACDDNSTPKPQPSTEEIRQAPSSSAGWLSWLSAGSAANTQSQPVINGSETDKKQAETMQLSPPHEQEAQPVVQPQPTPENLKSTKPTTSWFGFWSSTAESTSGQSEEQESAGESNKEEGPQAKEGEDVVMQDAPSISVPTPVSSQPSAGSTWAFWSRDTASKNTGEVSAPEQGELAVIGDNSETSPKKSNVQVNEDSTDRAKLKTKSSKEQRQKDTPNTKSKRSRPRSLDTDESSTSRPATPDVNAKNVPQKPTSASTNKPPLQNLLLPSFKSTYRMKENPSIIKQIAQLLLRTQQSPTNHVFLSKEIPKVKKAIAIGVHGLFPASYLRPMIGQPTGTSSTYEKAHTRVSLVDLEVAACC